MQQKNLNIYSKDNHQIIREQQKKGNNNHRATNKTPIKCQLAILINKSLVKNGLNASEWCLYRINQNRYKNKMYITTLEDVTLQYKISLLD